MESKIEKQDKDTLKITVYEEKEFFVKKADLLANKEQLIGLEAKQIADIDKKLALFD